MERQPLGVDTAEVVQVQRTPEPAHPETACPCCPCSPCSPCNWLVRGLWAVRETLPLIAYMSANAPQSRK